MTKQKKKKKKKRKNFYTPLCKHFSYFGSFIGHGKSAVLERERERACFANDLHRKYVTIASLTRIGVKSGKGRGTRHAIGVDACFDGLKKPAKIERAIPPHPRPRPPSRWMKFADSRVYTRAALLVPLQQRGRRGGVSTRALGLIWLRWSMASLNSGQNWADSVLSVPSPSSLSLFAYIYVCMYVRYDERIWISFLSTRFCRIVSVKILFDSIDERESERNFEKLESVSRINANLLCDKYFPLLTSLSYLSSSSREYIYIYISEIFKSVKLKPSVYRSRVR